MFSGSAEWFKTGLKYHTLFHACCGVEVVFNFSSAGNVVIVLVVLVEIDT